MSSECYSDNPPTSRDGDRSSPRASHSLRLPVLNSVQAGVLLILALTFVVWTCDPKRNDGASPTWSSRMRHPPGKLWTVAFSPNGRLLVTGADNGALVLWETGKGVKKDLSSDRLGRVFCSAFSLDGSILAAGHGESSVSLWNVSTGNKLTTLRGHSGLVMCLAFSPNGKTLASGGDDPSIRLWDIPSGETKANLPSHHRPLCALCFAPDGLTLASACVGGVVTLWDPISRGGRKLIGPNSDDQAVMSLSFSPDGSMLALGSASKGLRLWDLAAGRELTTTPSEAHSVREVKFSNDGRKVVEVRHNGVVVLRDLATKRKSTLVTKCPASYGSSISCDARFVAIGGDDGSLNV